VRAEALSWGQPGFDRQKDRLSRETDSDAKGLFHLASSGYAGNRVAAILDSEQNEKKEYSARHRFPQ